MFHCNVNVRSMHKGEFLNKRVGSLINWYNSNCEVILSIVLPSKLKPAFTCSKLTKETLEQGVKYIQR